MSSDRHPSDTESTLENASRRDQAALKVAEQKREDLEAIAASDLPFSRDAEKILRELEEAENTHRTKD